MIWDIILALVAFASQFLTAYIGWRVTVDGVKPERKRLYEALFALGGFVGALAIIISTYRAGEISHDLAELKQGQQTVKAGIQHIETNPPTVVVSPPVVHVSPSSAPTPAAQVNLLNFESALSSTQNNVTVRPLLAVGHLVEENFYFGNSGSAEADKVWGYGRIYIVSTESEDEITRKFIRELSSIKHPDSGYVPTGGTQNFWFTASSDREVTTDDLTKLSDGTERLYMLYAMHYEDQTGKHYEHWCRMLLGIPAKVNADSGGKPNGIPERR
jgi:hypothetical protein